MANAGRVAIVPKGDWDSSEAYKRLDAVTYNNILYIAKKVVPKNTAVTNTDYWMPSVAGGVAVKATTKNIGQVQPDGETIEVDADGKISAKTALDTKPTIIATAEPNIVDTVESPMLVTNATKNFMSSTIEQGNLTKNDGSEVASSYIVRTAEFIPVDSDKKYVITFKGLKYVGVHTYDSNKAQISDSGWQLNNYVFSVENNCKYVRFVFKKEDNQVIDITPSDVSNVMLTTDISATYDDFVPYDGYEIKSCGKNLFKNYDVYGKYKVVAETYNGNKVIYSSEAWGGAYQSDLILKKGKTYSISAYVKGSGLCNVYCNRVDDVGGSAGIYVKIALSSEWTKITKVYTPFIDVYKVRLEAEGGGSLYVSCFQIEEGSQATDYEPYKDGGTVHIDSLTEFPLLGLKSFDGETNIISPGNVEVTYAKSDSGKAILGMCKPTVKNLVSTVEGNPLDATMGAQLKKEIDELKAKVDAMSTSTTTE